MRHRQSAASRAIEEEMVAAKKKPAVPPDGLAEQLWAEHGWSLTSQDVARILIGVLVLSVFLAY